MIKNQVFYSLSNLILNTFLNYISSRPQRPNLIEDPTIKKIADRHNKSTAQILLKYLVQKNIVVIPKSVTDSRIRDNINLFDFTLDSDDLKILEALDQGEEGRRSHWDFNLT